MVVGALVHDVTPKKSWQMIQVYCSTSTTGHLCACVCVREINSVPAHVCICMYYSATEYSFDDVS